MLNLSDITFYVKLVRYHPSSIRSPCLLLFITRNILYTMCMMCSTSISNFTYLPLIDHCFNKMTVKENFHKWNILFPTLQKIAWIKVAFFSLSIITKRFMTIHYEMVVPLTPLVYTCTMSLLTVSNWPSHQSTFFPLARKGVYKTIIIQQNSLGLPATLGGLLAVQSPDVASSRIVLLHFNTMKAPDYKSDYL